VSHLLAAAADGVAVQVVQILGALLVLSAFVGAQRGVLHTGEARYLLLNVIGAGTLAVLAALDRQYGFLLLEGAWMLVALVGLIRAPRAPAAGGQRAGRVRLSGSR
jgi:hypothetical protein